MRKMPKPIRGVERKHVESLLEPLGFGPVDPLSWRHTKTNAVLSMPRQKNAMFNHDVIQMLPMHLKYAESLTHTQQKAVDKLKAPPQTVARPFNQRTA